MKQVSLMLIALGPTITNAYAIEPADTVASEKTIQAVEQRIIKGAVTDRKGQPLIGATVKVKENLKKNAVTDIDGKYSLEVNTGIGLLACSYIGYEPKSHNIRLDSDTIVDFSMLTLTNELSDVVVLSKSVTDRVRSTQPGMERIDISEMAKTPVIFLSLIHI